MSLSYRAGLVLLSCALLAAPAWAEEEKDAAAETPEAKVTVVLSKLLNPSGIALQPETGRVFVSDSGAGQVVSFDPAARSGNKAKVVVEIGGFSLDKYGKGPIYDIGPLGLLFLDENTLVVGGGDLLDGAELMRIYDLSSNAPLQVDDTKFTLGPIGPGEQSAKGEGNFYGLAANKTAIYITSNGDDTKGWVVKIPLENGKPGELTTFIATKIATEPEPVDAPVGIALNRDGHIVVGQMGEMNVPHDSLYTVYDPEDGQLKARASTGLYDIAGLAYSPVSGKLYAVDFAWMSPEEGGLFRLDVDEEAGTVQAVKIVSLDKPSSLAFAPDGTLYVACFGTAEEGSETKPGSLVKIEGDL